MIVVWEFGRVAVWDVQSGRAAEELGEVKLASGRLSSGWGVRRVEGKTEGKLTSSLAIEIQQSLRLEEHMLMSI